MKELRSEIKKGTFKPVYLFFGEENYLIKLYEAELTEAVFASDSGAKMMNMDVFEGKGVSIAEITDAANTLPFLSDFRLIICKNTMLFAAGRKDDSEKMAAYLKEIPETTIILFSESDVDRRGRLYKRLSEYGRAVDFKPPTDKEITDWICRTFKKSGYDISFGCAEYMLKTVPNDMDSVMSEMEKLIAYKSGRQCIKESDIDAVCTKSLETRIFELVDAVGYKKPVVSLEIFNNLMLMKESPLMVIGMIARQFRLMLQCKHLLGKGMHEEEIAREIGQRSFVVRGIAKQSVNFSMDQLLAAFTDCLEADVAIKTGKINDKLAVELLIMKYSS